MEIKTKFNFEDIVYYLTEHGEVNDVTVAFVEVLVDATGPRIFYYVLNGSIILALPENEVFASRQEAMEYYRTKNL